MLRAAAIDLDAERAPLSPAEDAAEPAVDMRLLAVPLVDGRLPEVRDVASRQQERQLDGPFSYYYLPRDFDEELAEAIRPGGLVVVTGPPGAGQRRSLWEAAGRALWQGALAMPSPIDGALTRVLKHPAVLGEARPVLLWLDPAVAFLDELERTEPGVLVGTQLPRQLCVLAIFEQDELERGEEILRRAAAEMDVSVHVIPRGLSEAEVRRARQIDPALELDPADPWSGTELEARERALPRLRELGDEAALSEALRGYARTLGSAGRYEEALEASAEDIELWRAHAQGLPSSDALSALADRLEEMAFLSLAVQRSEQAMEAATEAVRLRREVARAGNGEQAGRLGRSLLQLGGQLAQAERLDDALAAAEESVALFRELVSRTDQPTDQVSPPDRDLAIALERLSQFLAQAGRSREALAAAEEVVELHRLRDEMAPDESPSLMAYSLMNLAGRQGDAGDWKLAAETAEQGVEAMRRLPDRAPLAGGLGEFARILTEAGRRPEAITALDEAIGILRQNVPAEEPWRRTSLGHLLLQLAPLLAAESRDDAALGVAAEALEMWRTVDEGDPTAKYWLSTALEVAAAAYDRVGRLNEAIALDEEHLRLLDAADEAERREFVQQTFEDRLRRAGRSPGSREAPPQRQETAETALGKWAAARIAAGISRTGGTLLLYADRLVFRQTDVPLLDEDTVELPLEEIGQIEVLEQGDVAPPAVGAAAFDRGASLRGGDPRLAAEPQLPWSQQPRVRGLAGIDARAHSAVGCKGRVFGERGQCVTPPRPHACPQRAPTPPRACAPATPSGARPRRARACAAAPRRA